MSEVLKVFKFDGEPVTKEAYGSGHINSTFLVVTDKNKKYILQKINNKIFPNVEGLMNNIMLVTEHLKKKTDDSRKVLSIVKTVDDKPFAVVDGEYWRAYDFVEDSICLQLPENNDDFYARYPILVVIITLVNDEFRSESISHFFLKLFKYIRAY